MTPQQQAELAFWRGEFDKYGVKKFVQLRKDRDFFNYAELLPEIKKEHSGRGLDLGCGLVSILDGFPALSILAVDALQDEYAKIYDDKLTNGKYMQADGEDLHGVCADCEFDFVWCMNAIDHTPDPDRMIKEIHRVLKPDGRLYFFVNFDPDLYAPHYGLWDMRTVEKHLAPFKLLRGTQAWSETWSKYVYSALYVKDHPWI